MAIESKGRVAEPERASSKVVSGSSECCRRGPAPLAQAMGPGWEARLDEILRELFFSAFDLSMRSALVASAALTLRRKFDRPGQAGSFRTAWPNKGHWRKQITPPPKAPGHPRSEVGRSSWSSADQPLEKALRWRSRARAAPLSSTIQARAFAPARFGQCAVPCTGRVPFVACRTTSAPTCAA
jgi:hypothetical protein